MKGFGYYNYYANKNFLIRTLAAFFGERHFGYRIRHLLLKNSISDLKRARPINILEVGSAQGQTAYWLAEYFNASKITSIEINPKRVQKLNEELVKYKFKNLVFVNEDITTFSSETKFDLVVCSDVLEHVSQWQTALSNMVGVLNPVGRIFIHVPSTIKKYHGKNFGLRAFFHTGDDYNIDKVEVGEAHFYEGLSYEEIDAFLNSCKNITYEVNYTFSNWTMFLHTVFEFVRKKAPKLLYVVTPFLSAVSLETARRHKNGAGIKALIKK